MSLVFEAVSKHYADGTVALDNVSFTVTTGQVCVLLGPSGAGKSTLLRMVNGLVTPSAGRVSVDGAMVGPRNLHALRPRIGMIHQAFCLVGRSTVLANVLGGALPAVPVWRVWLGLFPRALQRRACALLADVGLDEAHLTRRADRLSGGQQQRVGVARAFMLDPDYVLADEPVASLDPQTGEAVLALLVRKARETGTTVFCSLHQIDLARKHADHIVALKAGRVVYDGTPEGLSPTAVSTIYETRADGRI